MRREEQVELGTVCIVRPRLPCVMLHLELHKVAAVMENARHSEARSSLAMIAAEIGSCWVCL
jgi:hypothetical protein